MVDEAAAFTESVSKARIDLRGRRSIHYGRGNGPTKRSASSIKRKINYSVVAISDKRKSCR